MKKAWRKICRRELLLDFLIFAALVCLAGSFLTFLIMRLLVGPVAPVWDSRLIGLCVAVVFIIILLAVVSLYRLSASYIRRYKDILDFVPVPLIVTDKNAGWLQINKAAREVLNLERDSGLGELNSRHLLSQDGSITEKVWTNNGTDYRVSGCRLDEGYIIFLHNTCGISDSNKTRAELIDEINKLFGQLSTATDQFHDCASSLAGYTVRQAGIINDLSGVIAEIASGELKEPDVFNERMVTVKTDMQQYAQTSQANLDAVKRTVEKLDAARDCIDDVLHNIDSGP